MTNTTTEGEAYVTLVTSDAYVVGALVLAQSLRRSGTTRPLVCLATSYLAADCVASLRELYDVRFVAPLDSGDEHSLRLLGRPELGPTFTKIQLWTMTDLKKAVFLDADMMVLKNIDDLFEREEFSACADVGWPDCFNSGLFVCQPNLDTFNSLLKLAQTQGSFDGNITEISLFV
jgi:glycogenin glucosyltransferase